MLITPDGTFEDGQVAVTDGVPTRLYDGFDPYQLLPMVSFDRAMQERPVEVVVEQREDGWSRLWNAVRIPMWGL